MTGLSSGQICVLYSPLTSLNGAKLLANKGPPRKATIEDMSDALAAPAIHVPGATPMFREGDGIIRTNKRKRDNDRADPRKARRPELPVTGPGRGGRVGASATQHVVQNLVRDTTRDEDVCVSLRDGGCHAGHFTDALCVLLLLSHERRCSSMRTRRMISNGLQVSRLSHSLLFFCLGEPHSRAGRTADVC